MRGCVLMCVCVRWYIVVYVFVCVGVLCTHEYRYPLMSETLDYTEMELEAVVSYWTLVLELNLGPLQDRYKILTLLSSLQLILRF